MRPVPYRFRRQGRSRVTGLAVFVVWLVVLAGWAVFDLTPWLALPILAATLPALRDLWLDPAAGVDLGDGGLRWYSGAREGRVTLDEIDHLRLVTRLDLSVRAAVVLKSGEKFRLPAEATPPPEQFQEALSEHDVRSERHHFTRL